MTSLHNRGDQPYILQLSRSCTRKTEDVARVREEEREREREREREKDL
jgi:hypothetical protein